MQGVGGGCTTPIGAHAAIAGNGEAQHIVFHAMLASDEGDRLERTREEFSLDRAADEVFALAQRMLRSVQPSWVGVSFGSDGEGRVSPLSGARVLVTGTPDPVQSQIIALRKMGADPVLIPTVRIEPTTDPDALDRAITDAINGSYDWMMVTSANAVPAIAERLSGGQVMKTTVGAVGEKTAEALSNIGVHVSVVPEIQSAEGLLHAMAKKTLQGTRILLPLSSIARPTLAEGLRERGAVVDVVTAYQTVPVRELDEHTRTMLKSQETNAVFLSSPSAVRSLVDMLGSSIGTISGAFFVAIGETTAAAMRAVDLPVHAIAGTPSADGMVMALLSCYGIDTTSTQLNERNSS